jgi:hypothetical protein
MELIKLAPVDRLDVTTLVDNTADALLPDVEELVVPGKCPSWQAHHALQLAMSRAYRPNSVGCRLELSATADEDFAEMTP